MNSKKAYTSALERKAYVFRAEGKRFKSVTFGEGYLVARPGSCVRVDLSKFAWKQLKAFSKTVPTDAYMRLYVMDGAAYMDVADHITTEAQALEILGKVVTTLENRVTYLARLSGNYDYYDCKADKNVKV